MHWIETKNTERKYINKDKKVMCSSITLLGVTYKCSSCLQPENRQLKKFNCSWSFVSVSAFEVGKYDNQSSATIVDVERMMNYFVTRGHLKDDSGK